LVAAVVLLLLRVCGVPSGDTLCSSSSSFNRFQRLRTCTKEKKTSNE